MKKFVISIACMMVAGLMIAGAASAEDALDKIAKRGKFIVGAREGSIPFGYYDKDGKWVGFSLDIAREIHKAVEKKIGKSVKLTFKPVNPKTRIPLVANRTVDMVCGSSTHTVRRDDIIDFSITFFLTGTRLLVPKGSPVKDFEDLANRRVGAARGSTNEAALRDANQDKTISPPAKIMVFDEHSKGFLALRQGKIDAYCTDGSLLAGIKQKAPDPDKWALVGRLLTYDPYAYILPENESNLRDLVNFTLIDMIKSGKFFELYDKWMGPKGVVPIPMTEEYKTLLKLQAWPH
ncbi:MAG: ABC transporter substrate-binding protein [Deltaproteobacteria bacterium]|nr:ABC transporter substrate-binding protein [Deltaproteobacteria bacterium]